ncbi:uncharacterized protein V6R79_006956 [Siganus canaliculatus]
MSVYDVIPVRPRTKNTSTHLSIHPTSFHSAGIPFSPRTVTHDMSIKSLRRKRKRKRERAHIDAAGQLRDQTNTWRRLTTQKVASPGGEARIETSPCH